MDELEEAEIEGQFFLRDAAVRAQPGAQQRPEALQGIDMDLTEAVTVVVARILAPAVADGFMGVAPVFQTGIDVVLVGIDQGTRTDGLLDDRPDRGLPDIGQQVQDDIAAPLDQAEDRRLLFFQRAAAALALQAPPPALAIFFWTAAGWPLWPATT
jgi:hypothetical protein